MRRIQLVVMILAGMAVLTGGADAQKKSTKKTSKKPPVAIKVIPPLEVRAAREKVDTQLSNLNLIVDRYGPIAQALELLDAAYATKKVSQATISKHENNKKLAIETLRNLRYELAALETEFRTKTALQKYLPNLQGITDLAARAEDSAIAGKFVAAKDPLREAARKLTNALTAMPL